MACQVCNKQYSSLGDRSTLNSDEKPHVCLTCGKSFSLKIQLKRHMQTHEDGKPFTCCECEKLDDSSYNLRLQKKNYACEECSKTFSTKKMLLQHATEHNIDCDQCDESFNNVADLNKHSELHHKAQNTPNKKQKIDYKKTYQCSECDKSFTQLHAFQKHLVSHAKYQCEACNAKFAFKKTLDQHCLSECIAANLSNDKKHVCSVCNKTFARKSALEGHIISHLNDEKAESAPEDDSDNDADFFCNLPGDKTYIQPKELCLPKIRIKRSFPCEMCEKICASQKLLEKHIMLSHKISHNVLNKKSSNTEKKKYTCRVCSEPFFSKLEYKKHKLTHASKDKSDDGIRRIKTYMCEICCEVFRKKKHLKRHFKTHPSSVESQDSNSANSSESPTKKMKRSKDFACKICGKLFAGEICLKKHELRHKDNPDKNSERSKGKRQKNVPNLICPFCNEDFTGRKFHFLRHKLSHTPEICGICDERFVDRAALREHLKTHIGTEEARKFLECSQKAQNFKSNLQHPEGKVEYIYLVLR